MERSFLDYAMSVICRRALPDVRDGLKPVHRRILWDMYEQGFRPDRPHVKCAHVTGDTMASYHPHGTRRSTTRSCAWPSRSRCATRSSTSTATTARPTSAPAAERYTECRLSRAGDAAAGRHRRGHRRLHRQLRRSTRSRPCCRPASRTCWSTAARASPSAWPPTSRRTTWARSSTPRIHLHRPPRGHRRRPDAVRQGPRLPDRRLHPRAGPASSTPTAPAGAR